MPGDEIDLDPDVTITVVASNGHVRGAVAIPPSPSSRSMGVAAFEPGQRTRTTIRRF